MQSQLKQSRCNHFTPTSIGQMCMKRETFCMSLFAFVQLVQFFSSPKQTRKEWCDNIFLSCLYIRLQSELRWTVDALLLFTCRSSSSIRCFRPSCDNKGTLYERQKRVKRKEKRISHSFVMSSQLSSSVHTYSHFHDVRRQLSQQKQFCTKGH